MSTYRSFGAQDRTDSPVLSSRGTQRSTLSASKVRPWFDNEGLELISNPGSGNGSRRQTPTSPTEAEIKPFKPTKSSLQHFSADASLLNTGDINALDDEGLSALHRAIRLDDQEGVMSLLDHGADVNISGTSGHTPLHAAVRFERSTIVKLLLQRRANPLKENENHATPLCLAAQKGLTEITRLMLDDSRVGPSAINKGDITPFHCACLGGNPEVCALLFDSGADITCKVFGTTPALTFAAWQGHEEACQLIIEKASIKLPSLTDFVNERDEEGKTALQKACVGGYEGLVDLLIRNGADSNAVDWVECMSPLHLAAKYGHLAVVELLILNGAVIDARNGRLRTPLHCAAEFNHGRIVELLLEIGADVEARDTAEMTPFLLAVTHAASHSVQVLLDNGADKTAVDSSLNSCLHLAISYCKTEMVKILLGKDKDKLLQLKDKNLNTVFHLAAGKKGSEILEILLREKEKGSLCQRDAKDRLALHIAAEKGSIHCVEALSRCPGFSFHTQQADEKGRTPLHLAAGNKHAETCRVLLKNGAEVFQMDLRGFTALHHAVEAGSLQTVQVLLDCRLPSTLERVDLNNNTPLHIACMHNHPDILCFLLDRGANVTAKNKRNMTCLDVAIEWEASEVATTLMRHPRWEEVLIYSPDDGVCSMDKLIEKLPNVAEIVLDNCITYSPLPPSHVDFSVKFNLIPLDPNTKYGCSNYFGPGCMAKHRREKLLNHNVTQALLRWKWMVLGKFVTFFNALVFAVFVVLFSSFIVKEREKVKLSHSSKNEITIVEDNDSFLNQTPWIIIVFLVLQLVKELVQMFWLRLLYFTDLTNWFELIMFAFVWIFTLPSISESCSSLFTTATRWSAGVLGLFMSYISLTLYFRRFGGLGLYVTMYVEVLFTFVKVISTFMIALTGYALVFFILLKEQGNFSDFWFSTAKILVMMVGELDYTDILVEHVVNNQTVPGTSFPYVPLPRLTFALFLVFILMVSIVLVNLLVGLAVGDIESIQRTASLRALIDQVFLVDTIMKSYPSWILRRIHKSSLEIKPNQNSFLKRVLLAGSDLSAREFMEQLLSRKSGSTTPAEEWRQIELARDETQGESIRNLQATVEAQGRLLQAMADRLRILE